MQTLNLVAVSGNLISSILLDKTHTIREVKSFIINQVLTENLSSHFVYVVLLYNDTILECDRTIENYNIKDGDSITIVNNNYKKDDVILCYVEISKSNHSEIDPYKVDELDVPYEFTIKQLESYMKENYPYNIIDIRIWFGNDDNYSIYELGDDSITIREYISNKKNDEMMVVIIIENKKIIKDNKIVITKKN